MNDHCPLCASRDLLEAVRRSGVPVHQNRLFSTRVSAVAARRGDLSIVLCRGCGFIFNRAFDPNRLDYSADYDNAQHHSPAFSRHLASVRSRIVARVPHDSARLLEVGCGQGDFLSELVADCGPRITASGYDPAFRGAASMLDGRIRYVADYFGADQAESAADVVFSRHVIEHIPDPIPFLKVVASALDERAVGRLFLETPCVEWILSNRVWWDFFYEHCSYWSPGPLSFALAQAGLQLSAVTRVFDGQYLWAEAVRGRGTSTHEVPDDDFVSAFVEFGRSSASDIRAMNVVFSERASQGAVALWGAGAKGATCAVLVDPAAEVIDCVVDINTNKQGKFIGGSGHPIVGPSELASRGITDVFVMNPSYVPEVASLCERLPGGIRVVALEHEVRT